MVGGNVLVTGPISDIFSPRSRSINITLLEQLTDARTTTQWREAVQHCSTSFHPSLFAESDHRVRFFGGDTRERLVHASVTVFMFTLESNLQSREGCRTLASSSISESVSTAFYLYRTLGEEVGCHGDPVRHIRAARAALRAVFPTLPGNEQRLKELEKSFGAAVRNCADRGEIPCLIAAALNNVLFLLLDAPATRLQALRFLWEHGITWELISPWGGELRDSSNWIEELSSLSGIFRQAGLEPGCAVIEELIASLRLTTINDGPRTDAIWNFSFANCGRCAMFFSARYPEALGQDSPSISARDGLVFFPAWLGRADCNFCGASAHVEAPGLLYWKDRRAIYYRVPRTPHLEQGKATEYYRKIIEGLHARYRSQLPEAEANEFDAAVEVIAHGWEEWLEVVQSGDVYWEDHVMTVIESRDGVGVIVDLSKRFMRELTVPEYEQKKVLARNFERRWDEMSEAYSRPPGSGIPAPQLLDSALRSLEERGIRVYPEP